MFSQIAFYQILGLPAIAWGGMATFALLVFTGMIGSLNMKGVNFLSVKWHKIFAYLTILFGFFHGLLGILAMKGF